MLFVKKMVTQVFARSSFDSVSLNIAISLSELVIFGVKSPTQGEKRKILKPGSSIFKYFQKSFLPATFKKFENGTPGNFNCIAAFC